MIYVNPLTLTVVICHPVPDLVVGVSGCQKLQMMAEPGLAQDAL